MRLREAFVRGKARNGDCWDNACTESFFHSLKVELVHGEPLLNGKQPRESILNALKWTTIAIAATAPLALLARSTLR